jgi:hypothetical protein
MPTPLCAYRPEASLLAKAVEQAETMRIAAQNNLRALTRNEADKDGITRGLGFPDDAPVVIYARRIVDDLLATEQDYIKTLEVVMKQHPFAPFIARTNGVGAKQLARLLDAIRDPYINDRDDRPRTVSELWSLSGYAVVNGEAPRLRRGQRANWSPQARMRAYLIAVQALKSRKATCKPDGDSDEARTTHIENCGCSPYRIVYDQARAKYADAVHVSECVRCGPSGSPAQPGSPLAAGHQHGRALRKAAKELLKDLWREARWIHWLNDGLDVDAAQRLADEAGMTLVEAAACLMEDAAQGNRVSVNA